MRMILSVILLMTSLCFVKAQETHEAGKFHVGLNLVLDKCQVNNCYIDTEGNKKKADLVDERSVSKNCEIAIYPEGLTSYLREHVEIPAKLNYLSKVIPIRLSIKVDAEGNVTAVETDNKDNNKLLQNVLNCVKGMPAWTPGLYKNQNVATDTRIELVYDTKLYDPYYDEATGLFADSLMTPQDRSVLADAYCKMGCGEKISDEARLFFLDRASRLGNGVAFFFLGENATMKKNKAEAETFYKACLFALSRKRPYTPDACLVLSYLYRIGLGTEKNDQVADMWFEKFKSYDVMFNQYVYNSIIANHDTGGRDCNPSYPGGEEALMQFIKDNLEYPSAAAKSRIEGRVYVSFIINEDGSLSDIKAMRSPSKVLTEEALRVVRLMPKWNPAKMNDMPVGRTQYVLPVVFRLK